MPLITLDLQNILIIFLYLCVCVCVCICIHTHIHRYIYICCCQVTSVMSDSVWPHRRQPIRLPHPWDSPGKNTGVGCHFLLSLYIYVYIFPFPCIYICIYLVKRTHTHTHTHTHIYIVIQCFSRVSLWSHELQHARLSCPSLPPKACSRSIHWFSDAIQPPHPLLSPSPPAFNLFQCKFFPQWVSSSHQVAKGLELQLQLSPSNEYSGLISFRIDWFDILAVPGILKSPLHYHSSKASVIWCSAFFMVQLSYPYMTTGKNIALAMCNFVGKVMSLLF